MTLGRLAGKSVIVTGAGQGIGRGIALAMAVEGAGVTLFARTAAKLEETAAEIEGNGGRAIVVTGDVTSADDRMRCVAAAVETFGRIDTLVNSALASPDGARARPFLESTDRQMAELWETGFVAVVHFMHACYPHLKETRGSVINFGSVMQQTPHGNSIYGGVKAAVQSMSRGAALEWAPDRIRVNVIYPLAVTPGYADWAALNPDWNEQILRDFPMGMGDPQRDVGRPCVFLASEEAGFITGATVPLDGGHSFVR